MYRLRKKLFIVPIVLAILLATIVILHRIGRNKYIFMHNGKPLSHGKAIIKWGSDIRDQEFLLDENGTLDLDWTLFGKSSPYFLIIEDAHGNYMNNFILPVPVHGESIIPMVFISHALTSL